MIIVEEVSSREQALQHFLAVLPIDDLRATEIIIDGTIQRFGPKQRCWYTLHSDGQAIYGHFGDWREFEETEGWSYFECRYSRSDDEESKEAARLRRQEADEAYRKALKQDRANARKRAAEIWASAKPADNEHPYLKGKGIKSHGLRITTQSYKGLELPLLVVPIYSIDGGLQTLQVIDTHGQKHWLPGGAKKAHYFRFGDKLPLYIAEGYATCASIHEATGCSVAMAGDKGNLLPVAGVIRARIPDLKIVLCADTDAVVEAEAAARSVGAMVVVPRFSPGVSGTDFNDLATAIGLEATAEQLRENVSNPIRSEPEPLRRKPPPPEKFPIESLGPLLGETAKQIREITKAPMALCGNSVLAAAALAVQPHLNIAIDERVRPVSIYAITVAESGERKSAVDDLALRSHAAYEAQLHSEYQVSKETYVFDRAVWRKAQADHLKDHQDEQARREALESLGSEPQPPLIPILMTQDPTLEGLVKILQKGLPGIGIFSDEGGLLIGGYAFSKDIALRTASGLSRAWDGKPVDRVRATDDLIKLYDRRVSMHLMMQPVVLAQLFGNLMLTGQGLLSRCLVTYPESTIGQRPYTPGSLDDPVLRRYDGRLYEILSTPWPTHEGRLQQLNPRPISPDDQARALWIEFHNDTDQRCKKGGPFQTIRGFANKGAEHALRIAAVLEGVEDLDAGSITLPRMENAIKLVNFFLSEALRIGESSLSDPKILQAEEFLEWLSERDEFHLTQVYQYGPASLRTKAKAMEVIRLLEEHQHVVRIKGGKDIDGAHRRDVWRIVR